jgi:phenylacetate-CoA ligase
MAGFLGRSDNMVKLRGINVFPQGIGTILAGRFPETNGEFVCRAFTAEGRDEMVVLVEVAQATDALKSAMESVLRERLGVAVAVEPVAPGATAPLTGLESRQKPARLIDERKP